MRFEARKLEFNEGDIGLAGGIQAAALRHPQRLPQLTAAALTPVAALDAEVLPTSGTGTGPGVGQRQSGDL